MADRIIIKGIEPYEGEYEFDPSYFTNRELHTIKRLADVRAGELLEALAGGDSDMLVALAIVCLQRHSKFVDEDLIWDANAGSITYEGEQVEDDAGPPVPPSGVDLSSGDAEKSDSSGLSGENGSSSTPPSSPSATGEESSEPSATSVPGTWGTSPLLN